MSRVSFDAGLDPVTNLPPTLIWGPRRGTERGSKGPSCRDAALQQVTCLVQGAELTTGPAVGSSARTGIWGCAARGSASPPLPPDWYACNNPAC